MVSSEIGVTGVLSQILAHGMQKTFGTFFLEMVEVW
jgi:hypothetical protein